MLEKDGRLENYESVEVAPYLRSTRKDLISDHEFVDQKYHKYATILTERLNKIHNSEHSVFFWKKCLALALLRNIVLFYDMFKMCEMNFSVDKFDCQILSQDAYHVPKDFNEHRDFFQCTAYGQEQLFSIYINQFYPDVYKSVDSHFSWPKMTVTKPEGRIIALIRRLFRATPTKIIEKLVDRWYRLTSPTVAIVESYFTQAHLNDLRTKSSGRIRWIPIKSEFSFSSDLDHEVRREMSASMDDFDRFDQFFFASLEYCFPKIFLEGFDSIYSSYFDFFKKYNKLTAVVNESWIGNNYAAIAVAILQEQGVKHIYNEHNFLSHHFLGNNHKYIIPLVDEFLSLGWFKKDIPKLKQGSSLFQWVEYGSYPKEYDLLFVSGPPAAKPPEISASYGDFGAYNAKSHLNFNQIFFNNLNDKTIRSIVYRGYPLDSLALSHLDPPMFSYDQEYVLRDHLENVKAIDSKSRSAKILMQKSNLVVIDYLSTSYIESMLADIPTVFFWNTNNYYLCPEYSKFYESLCSVGICQTDPEDAASFIESIINDPLAWWKTPIVQSVKNNFLDENFGKISVLKEYLLKSSN